MLIMPSMSWFSQRAWLIPPYSLSLLKAIVPEEFEVQTLDPNLEELTIEETANRIRAFAPDVAGVTCMSLEYARSAHKIVEIIKGVSPETLTVMGGVYCTVAPDLANKDDNVDYLVMGEAEIRFPDLLKKLNQGIREFPDSDGIGYRKNEKFVVNPMTCTMENLDDVPFPAYDDNNIMSYIGVSNKFSNVLSPRYYPYAVMVTSRGCPFSCIYCSTPSIHGSPYRYQSPERVLKEIDWLVDKYGVKEVIFMDDNLILNKKRWREVLKGIIHRKVHKNYDLHWKSVNLATFVLDDEMLHLMKESGAYQLILPIESGNQEVLTKVLRKPLKLKKAKKVIKKAKSMGFEITCDFIIGTPGETWNQIRETFQYAEEIDVDMVSFHVATPLPRTEMFELAQKTNSLANNFDFENFKLFGFAKGTIQTEHFTPDQLHILRAYEWDRINFKTQEKRNRFAHINGITHEELEKWRRETIRDVGLSFPDADQNKYDESLDMDNGNGTTMVEDKRATTISPENILANRNYNPPT